eukprot:9757095-Prorocentrum_lima.AAC.1
MQWGTSAHTHRKWASSSCTHMDREVASRIASGVAAVVRDHHNQRYTNPVDHPPIQQRDRQ